MGLLLRDFRHFCLGHTTALTFRKRCSPKKATKMTTTNGTTTIRSSSRLVRLRAAGLVLVVAMLGHVLVSPLQA